MSSELTLNWREVGSQVSKALPCGVCFKGTVKVPLVIADGVPDAGVPACGVPETGVLAVKVGEAATSGTAGVEAWLLAHALSNVKAAPHSTQTDRQLNQKDE